ncbi:MAG: HDOD domain-containing protein [Thermodesulfobacteria bacterium]|nr:HDOD domain-containing protein [Thermodesulfobacteriota bacterium]
MVYALAIATLSSIVLIIILFIAFRTNKGKKHSPKEPPKQCTPPEDIFSTKKPIAEPQEDEIITLVDYLDETRPSPERPITDEDAALIDIIRQSPELPSAIMELSHLLRDPDSSIKRIVQLISTDPVLSSKVLRVVNSAAFCTQKITSLQHAVVILGFNELWILVNQLLANSALTSLAELSPAAMKSLWRHAAATATCAKHVLFHASNVDSNIGPTVITCSLLHDVGKFLLRGLSPDGPPSSEDDSNEPCSLVSVVKEDEYYGIDHCRMAYLLTTYWKLPEILCTTISYHHHPSFANWEDVPGHAKLPVALVALSDMLANAAGYWDSEPCAMKIHPDMLKAVGLDKDWSLNKLLTKDLIHDLKDTERLIETAVSV